MMSVLVFLVLIFGLFGVISAQYIMQYREAYYFWIKEIVYNKNEGVNFNEKKEICSKIESYSREICELANMILLLFFLISITFFVVVFTIEINKSLMEANTIALNLLYATEILAFILYISLFVIMDFLKIGLINNKSKTSAIDEKLFKVWFKFKCHDCKQEEYSKYLEPRRLYEIVAEKLDNDEIEVSNELFNLVEPLRQKKDVNFQA